jgi:hypothetical protein
MTNTRDARASIGSSSFAAPSRASAASRAWRDRAGQIGGSWCGDGAEGLWTTARPIYS